MITEQAVSREDGVDRDTLYATAEGLQELGEYHEALLIYSALYFVDSENPKLPLKVGLCRLAMGDRAEARDGFKMALDRSRNKSEHAATHLIAKMMLADSN